MADDAPLPPARAFAPAPHSPNGRSGWPTTSKARSKRECRPPRALSGTCSEAVHIVLLHQQRAMIGADYLARITLLADAAVLDPDGASAQPAHLGHRMRDEQQRAPFAEIVDPVEALALEG